ncbi:Putative AAA+ ATPase domain, ABC transporter type 1, transmembrane domain-containing protein [Colletotrichum destructivum]|uniref:AAA+ ATPase domain, ABC transporter type 1, transmembrane domain-containing protein n=1 Tax=Colletotrichum destructivum TaxID=34406 RepID=A0AAX4I607_9PEZI|nr:Putative AAA+ ATPase domain, ABC transporter type 1, transmembrane domain-containing protein [Colletotrichum destructivum]
MSEMPPEARFAVVAGTGAFDFTPAFEDAVLCIAPSALFLVVALQRLFWLARQPRKVAKSHRPIFKVGLIGVYTALQLAVLLYWALNAEKWPSFQLRTSAAALSFVDGLLLLFLSHAEHARSVRPSTIINVYLLFTLLFDCVVARTLWLADHEPTISSLFTSTVAIKVFVLTSEAWGKRPILLSQYQNLSPEVTSGILARSVFWWLNSLMRTGFARPLDDDDLLPIHDSLSARTLLHKARNSFASSNQSNRHALAFSTLWATKYIFLAGVAPRLALAAFKYTLPFLITKTTSWTADPSQSDAIGWGLTGAWLLVFLGQAISNGFYYQMTYRFVTSIRGSLCSLIYTKTLDLSSTALDESVPVSLMSTDTESICQSAATLHELWASPIESAVAIFLLYRQLGLAALAPVVVAIIATAGMLWLAQFIGMAKKRWMMGIQTRVDVTAYVLASIKATVLIGSLQEAKMLGLSDIVANTIQNLRNTELDLSKQYRRLLTIQTSIAMNTAAIAPLATFATFVIVSKNTGQPLNTEYAYASLSLIYLLSNPLVVVFRTIPFISAALACFSRIQNYLLSESYTDYRLPLTGRHRHPNQDDEKEDTLVAISGASFGWAPGKPDSLNGITVNIRRSCFTFVVGPVGSGKSTLMRAILGEVPLRAGSTHADPGNIAFVGQEPWIQNLTIRQNILGSVSYDAEWYGKVVYACGLEQDIGELPNGDATRAGSAGFSLSGGQKQRLALARAVYSREKTVLLDDVFAGQDAATEEHVFQNLFAETGLFRQMSITLVCVTNAIHRLAYADHVVALDGSGHIVHQGSFAQLQSDTDYLHGLAVEQNGAIGARDAAEAPVQHRHENVPKGRSEQDTGRNSDESGSPGRILGEFATYAYYFGSVPVWYTILFAVLIIMYAGGHQMTALVLSFWTDTAEESGQATDDYYLGLFGLLTSLAVLGIAGAAYFFLIVMVPLSSEVLHARLLRSVMEAPVAFFSRTDVGVTTNRFSQDMAVIDTELPFALVDFCVNFALIIMSVILMCIFSGYFAAALVPFVAFCWLLQKFYVRTSRQIRLFDLEAKSPLFTQFLDLLQGLSTVRAFAWGPRFIEQYLDLLDASQRPFYLLFCIQRWLGLVLDLMTAVLVTVMMVLVVNLRAQLSAQYVALALVKVMSFGQSLAHVIQDWTQLETSFGAVARVKMFCTDTESENRPAETDAVPENWPAHGRVTIEHLVASYNTLRGGGGGGEPVLRGVSLDIPAGAKVGICGRSGSGKSSLLGCILRLLDVGPGSRITIDGVDIMTLPRQAVRAAVAVVPQHPFFLKHTSLRDNLVVLRRQQHQQQHTDDDDDDDKILQVLRRLKMDDIVDRLGGLDSPLDADRLSQGQRQLLCIARAMLAGKRIILIDEASSNVDERSERLIRDVMREQFASCTVIAVAHRLGAVVDFDRVAVMGGGRLLEWDSPRALLKRNSEFKRLWDLGTS